MLHSLPLGVPKVLGGIITDNLQLHLDAGDSASYSGSGETWADLTANGYDWYLGKTGTVDGDEAAFVSGTPDYFDHVNGDEVYQAQAAYSGSILRTFGRNNQAFTIEMWAYLSGTSLSTLIANAYGSADNGLYLEWSRTSQRLSLSTYPLNDGFDNNSTNISTNAWHQLAITGTCDGTTGTFVVDGAADGTWSENNSGWSTGDSTKIPNVAGRNGDTAARFQAGSRLGKVRIYDVALSVADLNQNFEANRDEYGI